MTIGVRTIGVRSCITTRCLIARPDPFSLPFPCPDPNSPLNDCREADGTVKAGGTPDSAWLHPGYVTYRGSMRAVLGNGKDADLDVFAGTVIWDGQVQAVMVLAADGSPLVGMGLLAGSRVVLHVTDNGSVSIEPLP